VDAKIVTASPEAITPAINEWARPSLLAAAESNRLGAPAKFPTIADVSTPEHGGRGFKNPHWSQICRMIASNVLGLPGR